MDTPTLLSILGIVAGIILGFISGWFSLTALRKGALHNTLRELFAQQLVAYKILWSVVFNTSRYDLGDGILQKVGDDSFLDVKRAKAFVKGIEDFFVSENGIFISRDLLKVLFKTRKYILSALNENHEKDRIKLSKIKIKQIKGGLSHIQHLLQSDINLRTANPAKQIFGDDGS